MLRLNLEPGSSTASEHSISTDRRATRTFYASRALPQLGLCADSGATAGGVDYSDSTAPLDLPKPFYPPRLRLSPPGSPRSNTIKNKSPYKKSSSSSSSSSIGKDDGVGYIDYNRVIRVVDSPSPRASLNLPSSSSPSHALPAMPRAFSAGTDATTSSIYDASKTPFFCSSSSPSTMTSPSSSRRGSETSQDSTSSSLSSSSSVASSLDFDSCGDTAQRRRRSGSVSSSTSSLDDDADRDSFVFLGEGAAQLLQQLEELGRASSPARLPTASDGAVNAASALFESPPRRAAARRSAEAATANRSSPLSSSSAGTASAISVSNSNWSPLGSSPIAGPSTYQRTRRPLDQRARTLSSHASSATIRASAILSTACSLADALEADLARSTSFTSTPFFDLDIDAILSAYEEVEPSSDEEETTRTPTRSIHLNAWTTSPLRRVKSSASVKPRKLIFPSVSAGEGITARARPLPRPPAPSSTPYVDIFSHKQRTTLFPSRQKSTTSLRSRGSGASGSKLAFDLLIAPPVPALPSTPLAIPPSVPSKSPRRPSTASSTASLSPDMARRQSTSSNTSGTPSSAGSSPTSTRSSFQSTAGGGSLRWSIASGSTAPTISEEGDALDDFSPALSYKRSLTFSGSSSLGRGPARKSPSSLRERSQVAEEKEVEEEDDVSDGGDMMDWQQFAEEVVATSDSIEDKEERPQLSTSKPFVFGQPAPVTMLTPPSSRPSPASSTSSLALPTTGTHSLARKMSNLSLKRFKFGANWTNNSTAPPMPRDAMAHAMALSQATLA